jgi:hypothetical protein
MATASNDYGLSTVNAFLSGSQSEESTSYTIENERVILVAPRDSNPDMLPQRQLSYH